MQKDKVLRVGFDLDGVLLYNPARILRPFAQFLRPFVFRKKGRKFYFPNTRIEKIVWRFLHKSSMWIAPGMKDILELAREKKIQAYIITARYDFLKHDFEGWVKKIDGSKLFTGHHYNITNKQPHLYKEHMIEKLDLDIFVEDNWGIVQHLSKQLKSKVKIFWIYNIFDKNINYMYKFPTLKTVSEWLKKNT